MRPGAGVNVVAKKKNPCPIREWNPDRQVPCQSYLKRVKVLISTLEARSELMVSFKTNRIHATETFVLVRDSLPLL
jgi:hypothetical protein